MALVAIYPILSRIALPRIGAILAERQGTITNDIAAAEELKLKAEEAEAAYNQALADARAEAQKIVAEAKAEIQKDLDAATAKADAEIAAKSAEVREADRRNPRPGAGERDGSRARHRRARSSRRSAARPTRRRSRRRSTAG